VRIGVFRQECAQGLGNFSETFTFLARAGGQHGPDALAPALSGGSARALRDSAIDHAGPFFAFRQMVRRFNVRVYGEQGVILTILPKSHDHVLSARGLTSATRGEEFILQPLHLAAQFLLTQFLTPVVKRRPLPYGFASFMR
jgi:hypothetical protein